MNPFLVISSQERRWAILLTVTLGITLAFSFLPAIHSFYVFLKPGLTTNAFGEPQLIEMSFFSFFCAILYLSIPKKSRGGDGNLIPISWAFYSFIIPVLIAALFGLTQRYLFSVVSYNRVKDVFWFVICIPIGEELLFRGWLWAILRSLFRKKYFSLTNPLPTELVLTSLAFSLWHLQNYSQVSLPFLVFQLLYTFLTGLWLGYLRWKTGKILISTLGHALINLASSLALLL